MFNLLKSTTKSIGVNDQISTEPFILKVSSDQSAYQFVAESGRRKSEEKKKKREKAKEQGGENKEKRRKPIDRIESWYNLDSEIMASMISINFEPQSNPS